MSVVFASNADFLPQFKAIGQSLKRRFFRKPNVADAVEQYEALCQELQREEQTAFAAICCLEAAKCQEALQNPISQGNLLVKAAKLFMRAREDYQPFEVPNDGYSGNAGGSVCQGHVQMAVQCLEQAAKIYNSQKHYGMSLIALMEAGEILYRQGSYGEALKLFKLALDVAKTNFTLSDQLLILDNVCKCKIKLADYESASKLISETLASLYQQREKLPPQLWALYTQRFEVTRVCLILLLGVNTVDLFKFIWPEGAQSNEGDSQERQKAVIHLKSLVLAVQHGSADEIQAVQNSFAHIINEAQVDLFAVLVQETAAVVDHSIYLCESWLLNTTE